MTKREAILIGTTFLLTSAAFVIGYFIFNKKEEPDKRADTQIPVYTGSDTISWDRAKELREAYLSFKPLRVRHRGRTGTGTIQRDSLRGFLFKSSNLLDPISTNASGETRIDTVAFFFGKSGEFDDGPEPGSGTGGGVGHGRPRRSADMQLIAIGVKNNKLLTSKGGDTTIQAARVLSAASIYDKADPCPPFCPEE
jgi:hypothetical protein